MVVRAAPTAIAGVPYSYLATIDRVIDGDTVVATLHVDLGFNDSYAAQRVWRLLGCNAREPSEPGGPEARDHLSGVLPVGATVVLTSIRVDPYTDSKYASARYDARITLADGRDLTTLLVTTGWAAAWDGHAQPRPIPPWPIPTGVARG